MKSLKTNYILNLLNTVTSILYPLITFPYASRILFAEGIGKVDFFSSIINYITLFTCLGIPLYAVREIARCKSNPYEMRRTTLEILLLHTTLALIGYIAVFTICLSIPRVYNDFFLFLILSSTIFFTAIGCEWFYKGQEEFTYITVRSLLVKAFSLVLLFTLVKSRDDLYIYGAITVLGTVGNNIFNFTRLKKYGLFQDVRNLDLKPLRHLKPALKIFVLNLIVSIYGSLDTLMLGFLKDSSSVGFYTSAHRITLASLSLVTSLGGVLLPRLSFLIKNNWFNEFKEVSQKAIDYVIFFAFPLASGFFLLSDIVIHLFCGYTFEPSIDVLKILAPIIIFISISNIVGIQILYPQGKEYLVIISTGAGALINVILNSILIPLYAQDGAAIGSIAAEFTVVVTMCIIGRRYIPVKLFNIHYMKCILATLIMVVVCSYSKNIVEGNILKILLTSTLGVCSYMIILFVLKDSFLLYIYSTFKKIITNRGIYSSHAKVDKK